MTQNRKKVISVIGPNYENCTDEIYQFGVNLGKRIIDEGYILACGGRQGVMEAVCKGAHQSPNYQYGCTIGILPEDNRENANAYCDIVIPTGIGLARNKMVINVADCVVAVAGGAGTMSEISFGWQSKKHVVCSTEFEGWSKKLAGLEIDNRSSGLLHAANTIDEIFRHISRLLEKS